MSDPLQSRFHLRDQDHSPRPTHLRLNDRHVRPLVLIVLCSLAIEFGVAKPISTGYMDAGGILLGLFVFEVTCWGIAWCWGARKREGLRRSIVEKQLAQIRAMEQAEEERDIEEERRMIEERRRLGKQ